MVAGGKVGALEDAILQALWEADEPVSGRELLDARNHSRARSM